MAKYKEVHEKQRQLEDMADRGEKMQKSLFVGFTFRHRKPDSEEGKGGKVLDKLKEDDETYTTMF